MKLNSLFNRKLGFAVFGLTLLVGFGFVVARSGPLAPTQVTVISVEKGSLSTSLFGIGTVEARRSYFIGPTAAGRVKAVHVDVGNDVKAGQLLAEIDPVDLDDRLRSLDAALARSRSGIAAAEAQRKDALARQQVAGQNARRYIDLGKRQFVSASAVESKQQELSSAQATVESAEANLQGAHQDQIRLQADLEGLRQQRQNLRLLAPRDGIVTSRDAEPGTTLVAGQSVVKIVAPESLWVKVRLDQGRSRGLALGQHAEISLRSNPEHRLPGKVARIEPVSDSVTEERVIMVSFDQLPAELNIGELAEVTVQTAANQSGLILPNSAIKHTVQGTGVWKLQDGQPRFILIQVDNNSLDGQVQVLSGIEPGDQIVVHSAKELSEGGRIKIVESLNGEAK